MRKLDDVPGLDDLAPLKPPGELEGRDAGGRHLKRRREATDEQADPPRWVCLQDVDEPEIQWLWNGRIPLGEIANITGPDGVGKTALAVYIVACLTTGRPLFGHTSRRPPCVVIWISTEESTGKVRRRLRKAGAALSRVIVLNDGERWLTTNVDELRAHAAQNDVGAVVVDALADAVKGDANNPSDVRLGLVPLAGFAHETGIPVLGLRHWGKAARDARGRSSGAHSWRDMARCQINVAEIDGSRAMAWDKLSDAEKPVALRFELRNVDGDPVLAIAGEWPGLTAEDLAKDEPMVAEERSAMDEALAFLRAELSEGPRSKKEIEKSAKDAGVSERTLRRAKDRLGVQAVPERAGGGRRVTGWSWALPGHDSLGGTCRDGHLDLNLARKKPGIGNSPEEPSVRGVWKTNREHRRSPSGEPNHTRKDPRRETENSSSPGAGVGGDGTAVG